MFLAKTKLNTIEVSISKALINSYINRNEYVSVYNVLHKYNRLKEEIKNCENTLEYTIFKHYEQCCLNCKKNTAKQIF